MRCFLGFELAEESRAALRGSVEQARARLEEALPGVWRVVPPVNWHVTLLFFAGLDATARAQVWEAARSAAQSGAWRELNMGWRGWVPWPQPRRAHLVCLDGGSYPQASEWPLFPLLEQEPFSKGDVAFLRRYHPHITVLRLRGQPQRRALRAAWQALEGVAPPPPGSIRLDRVSLFLRNTSQEQRLYTREATASL